MPFARPSAIIRLACSMRSRGMKYGLSAVGRILGDAEAELLAVELARPPS